MNVYYNCFFIGGKNSEIYIRLQNFLAEFFKETPDLLKNIYHDVEAQNMAIFYGNCC